MSKTVIILGGGVGGLVAANELRRKFPRTHRIVLIEKNPTHAFAPSFLWVMTGSRKTEQIIKPIRSLIRKGIDLFCDEVKNINISKRSVTISAQTLTYDYLVIALGAELAPQLIPGLTDNAHSFYTFQEASKLEETLSSFREEHIALVVAGVPYKCPGAPHEAAMLIMDYYRRRRSAKTVHLYTPEAQPMPVGGPELGEAVKKMITAKGILFHPLHKLMSVNDESRELHFEGKEPVAYQLLVAIPPHRAPKVVKDASLLNEAGWISVDRKTLQTSHENVYAIGDITAISIPGRWNPDIPMMLPKAGVFAHTQGEVVARRISDQIEGRISKDEFCGTGYCMLEAGDGLAGFAYGDFFGEKNPQLDLRNIGKVWHLGKILFEKWWLAPVGIRKTLLRFLISLGAKIFRIPIDV